MSTIQLDFAQAWTDTPQPIHPGRVEIQRVGDTLELVADLTDPDIHSLPAQFNDYAYTHSDVFELFIRGEGDLHYHELHITPNNDLLQLRFPGPRGENGLDTESAKVAHPLFDSSTERTEDGWRVRLSLPLANISEQSPLPQRWFISCGRYDYRPLADGSRKAVIANTAPLAKPDFHRIDEWPLFDLGVGA